MTGGAPPSSSPTTDFLVRPPLHGEGGTQPRLSVQCLCCSHTCIGVYFLRLSGVVLTQQDYYTIPSIDELDDLVEDGCCVVTGFTVGRQGYGEIHFPDKTDVFGMNLDQLG